MSVWTIQQNLLWCRVVEDGEWKRLLGLLRLSVINMVSGLFPVDWLVIKKKQYATVLVLLENNTKRTTFSIYKTLQVSFWRRKTFMRRPSPWKFVLLTEVGEFVPSVIQWCHLFQIFHISSEHFKKQMLCLLSLLTLLDFLSLNLHQVIFIHEGRKEWLFSH